MIKFSKSVDLACYLNLFASEREIAEIMVLRAGYIVEPLCYLISLFGILVLTLLSSYFKVLFSLFGTSHACGVLYLEFEQQT